MATIHSFANRWSKAIEEHGYTSLPTLLLYKRTVLNISVSEVYIILCIESFRWDKRNPWPSMSSIAKRAQCSARTARGHISSLEKKGHIRRHYRTGTSSSYSLEPLVSKLDQMAISSLPIGKRLPPTADKTFRTLWQDTSAKEESLKDRSQKESNIKNRGPLSMNNLIEKHPLKSNDFDKNGRL